MGKLSAYHRPNTIEEALQLLSRPGVRSKPIAGGTTLVPVVGNETGEVVDLQAVGLNQITVSAESATIGAMVRLQSLVDHVQLPPLFREMAVREGPNTLRNAATIGGVVIGGDWESELYAALLVHEAEIQFQELNGIHLMALKEFSPTLLKNGLLTGITIRTGGRSAFERVARTPADKPIVSVIGRKDDSGSIHIACCGVAKKPVLVDPDRIDALQPPSDFRGSGSYRREMAETLIGRVINQLA
jgi:CO/xanthine dehydrogenase FAD-binding subunit